MMNKEIEEYKTRKKKMKMRQVTNKTKEMIRGSNANRLLKKTQPNLYRSNSEKKMKKIYMKSKLLD